MYIIKPESLWYEHSKDPKNIIAKDSFNLFKQVHIHVSTFPGEGTRIDFASADDARRFIEFINTTNNSHLRVLPLSEVYSILGLPMPSIFADRDWGWLTPVDHTLECDMHTTMVHLAAPSDVSASDLIFSPQLLAASVPGDVARAVLHNRRTGDTSGRYWKHLEKPEPELPYPTKVIRSGPMTIAVWPDKSKTYVRIKDDDMSQDDPEKALALVTLKKLLGPHKFRKLFKEFLGKK